ncbi:hypothetical protein DFQ30_009892 [Apophysomyces sp. BC1015]|nr:hypothetical protein DFQ30_009892 [Apophysomyces sp. BC1015]KAG0171545.1 hypothetical protein DFQ29_008779 [Apophysomyces sp. BC1021]
MDILTTPAIENYNGGIVFLSYLISVVGAWTTLELLTRRTHIHGLYNWFLLIAAAFSMGGVGIWSMHFIGNNSLTLSLPQGGQYQLAYAAGFTFASLAVAILCMFIAFAFVGITEEVKLLLLLPSGIFAGLGIATMHYLGQFAINYFVLVYLPGYVVGAVVIACVAVTAAQYIFFKLREQWANQWYKRLGCSMLMAIAVCGMHYTALAGTIYYVPDEGQPPTPALSTAALIGIISGIVVLACVILLYIGFKGNINRIPLATPKKSRRLILGTVFFDNNDRILVKVDGCVPMKEVMRDFQLAESNQAFSSRHPLFVRLFETAIEWAANPQPDSKRPSEQSSISTNIVDVAARQFHDTANELREELRLSSLSDLGILFDTVIHANTITKPSRSRFRRDRRKSNHSWIPLYGKRKDEEDENLKKTSLKQIMMKSTVQEKANPATQSFDDATVIESSQRCSFSDQSISPRLSERSSMQQESDTEDVHIFLVRQISNQKDLKRLLASGYRFAESVFISRTMGSQLLIPADHMLGHFRGMQCMAESVDEHIKSNEEDNQSLQGGVYVGLFVLLEEEHTSPNDLHIMVNKARRSEFPLVRLTYEGTNEPYALFQSEEKNCIVGLSGQSLSSIASHSKIPINTSIYGRPSESTIGISSNTTLVEQKLSSSPSSPTTLAGSPPTFGTALSSSLTTTTAPCFNPARLLRSLEIAAQTLVKTSNYKKVLGSAAKLHSEVIDVPSFALTTGPCQLVLFRALITTSGTISAVNQTASEPIKCMPITLYRMLAFHVSDSAVDMYRQTCQLNVPETRYLDQQRMYRSTARGGDSPPKNDHSTDDTVKSDKVELSSLPPPPRVKRSKFQLPVLTGLDFDAFKDFQTFSSSSPKSSLNQHELPTMFTILSTKDRFWWLNSTIEEIMHSSQ